MKTVRVFCGIRDNSNRKIDGNLASFHVIKKTKGERERERVQI